MEELAYPALLLLAAGIGALFARFFPRLGLFLGWTIVIVTFGAWVYFAKELVKAFGMFWGLLFSMVVAILAMIPAMAGFSMVGMGRRVLDDEEARMLEPVALPDETPPQKIEATWVPDVEAYVARHFAPEERGEARALLEGARTRDGRRLTPRLARCALVASGGSLAGLREQVGRLRRDHNDVVSAAECSTDSGELVRVRDLARPLEPNA